MNLALQEVSKHYANEKNKIDIWAEESLSYANKSEHPTINKERSILIEKINEIEQLNLTYLKSNSLNSFDHPGHYFSPKFCFMYKETFRLIIVKHYMNINQKSNQSSIVDQILDIIVKNNSQSIIDLSSSQPALYELQIRLESDLKDNDFDLLPYLIDINQFKHLNIKFIITNFDIESKEFRISNKSFNHFKQLSSLVINKIDSINFGYCVKLDIEPNGFCHLSNLSELIIGSVGNRKISKNHFNGLNQLKKLSINDCDLDSGCFDDLQKLECLYLSGGSHVPPNMFEKIKNLRDVTIRNLKVDSFHGLDNIGYFFYQSSSILCENQFSSLKSLKKLKLKDVILKNANIFSTLSDLEELCLLSPKDFGDEISEIGSKTFSGLSGLKILKIYGYENFEIGCFDSLTNLIYLDLNNVNGIKNIFEIQKLKNLECLKYSTFKGNCQPMEDLNLPRLKYLFIDAPKIPNLKHLNLEFLNIRCLDESMKNVLLNQSKTLLALCLNVIYEFYDSLNKEFIDSFKSLVFLEVNVSFFDFEPLVVKDFYKQIIENSKFTQNKCSFKVSIYENLKDMIEKRLSLSKIAKDCLIENILLDRPEGFYLMDFFD